MNPRSMFLASTLFLLAVGWLFQVEPISAQSPAKPVTVFVVRHAERESSEADSPLSDQGWERARRLAEMLANSEITYGFSSEFQRTRQTLTPLAERLGFVTTIIPARDTEALLHELRRLPPGSRAIVASHSNLVHLIVRGLTGTAVEELSDIDYDRIYIVTIAADGVGTVVMLHF